MLNVDGIVGQTGELLGHNMFSYCKNNPINMVDPTGYSGFLIVFYTNPITAILATIAVVTTYAYLSSPIVQNYLTDAYHSLKFNESESDKSDEQIRKEGLPRQEHTVAPPGTRGLSREGVPNSSRDLLNEDGSVKQRRYYGENGLAQEDIDYNHQDDGNHKFPHRHYWEPGRGDPMPF